MKCVTRLLAVAGLVIGISSASALPFNPISSLLTQNSSAFDITAKYNPLTQVIVDNGEYAVKIGYTFQANSRTAFFDINIGGLDTISVRGNGGKVSFYKYYQLSDTTGVLDYLAEHGRLDLQISTPVNYQGTFKFKNARLETQLGARPPSSVPDAGSTAAMLGFGILALGSLTRRLKAI